MLGLALLAVFAFGAVVAASASAVESGILYLKGEEGPAIIKGEGKEVILLTDGLLKVEIKCTIVKFESEIGAKGDTHSTLGTSTVDFEGCKLVKEASKVACSSENTAGTKDPKEVILLVKEDTDVHLVALLNGSALEPGFLLGLLEESGHDLTLNCAGVKVLILGAVFLAVKGKNQATEEVKEIEIKSTENECDSADELCKTELGKWDVKALKLKEGAKEDETVLCPLGTFVEKSEECSLIKIGVPIVGTINKQVLLDF